MSEENLKKVKSMKVAELQGALTRALRDPNRYWSALSMGPDDVRVQLWGNGLRFTTRGQKEYVSARYPYKLSKERAQAWLLWLMANPEGVLLPGRVPAEYVQQIRGDMREPVTMYAASDDGEIEAFQILGIKYQGRKRRQVAEVLREDGGIWVRDMWAFPGHRLFPTEEKARADAVNRWKLRMENAHFRSLEAAKERDEAADKWMQLRGVIGEYQGLPGQDGIIKVFREVYDGTLFHVLGIHEGSDGWAKITVASAEMSHDLSDWHEARFFVDPQGRVTYGDITYVPDLARYDNGAPLSAIGDLVSFATNLHIAAKILSRDTSHSRSMPDDITLSSVPLHSPGQEAS